MTIIFERGKGTSYCVCHIMKYKIYTPLAILLLAFVLLLPQSQLAKADGTKNPSASTSTSAGASTGYDTEKPYVGVETVYESQQGRTVNFKLYIHGNKKIAGGSLDLLYDQTALSVQKAEVGDQLSNYMISVNTDQPGKVALAWAKAQGQIQDGTILTITARLLKSNMTTNLDLQNAELYKDDLSKITGNVFDGQVKPFKGDLKKHDSKVKGNKAWTIKFNKAVDPATVNENTVMVKDSRGNDIDVDVKAKDNKAIVVTPKSDYPRGTYTLLITEQVRTLDGSMLTRPVKYEFTVE